ncbi:NEDD8-activating enzyme E1 catalytic subunit-like isoform X2 [Oopsacas minuta]|uniref:NEDD8-activating enzyme E1 catalytic subunit n=1 Tax=Oopsacas minuta TaxID=111878 RepID=A0AAV7K0W1_9METZ|nr:NEDD8-activating enzyme E1 catalytic subunit-like isoform X2 [Oopsacas minuta]
MDTDPIITDRWRDINSLLIAGNPLTTPHSEASPDTLSFLRDTCKILVIGAGGLGCELLKNIALLGIKDIHVIDMDIIDESNLNRQFLFRPKDVSRPKALVAAEFINKRIPGANVTGYYKKIQDFDVAFYTKFHIIVCGLDSIVARRWINSLVIGLLKYNAEGELDQGSIIPIVDGGTEGFKGNARVIIPSITACLECTLDLYPPQVTYPLCTIATNPRLPEHCIEYVKLFRWKKEEPFGANVQIDGDNPEHIQWVCDQSEKRANEYRIEGVNYRLTQGVIKHIIPAVASTNAVIAAACATEVFKIATSCAAYMDNYMVINDTDGIYSFTYAPEKKDNCIVCSGRKELLKFSEDAKLREVVEYLCDNPKFSLKSPGITTIINGHDKTLYMKTKALEQLTKPNLDLTLKELGLSDGHEIYVGDPNLSRTVVFIINFISEMEVNRN